MLSEFRHKLQKLRHLEFESHDRHDWLNLGLSDEEILGQLKKLCGPELFLGRYTVDEIRAAFEERGIFKRLAELGFGRVEVEVNTDQVYTHRLYVHTGVRDYDHILIELRLREGVFKPRQQFVPDFDLESLPMIMVDYLLLQNPKKSFQPDRPPLPQQTHPGLGLLKDMIPLVNEVVKESGRAGVLDVPEHYHGALFYARWFRFFNPEMEGRFRALRRDLGAHPVHLASRCIYENSLVNETEKKYEDWSPGEQILPIAERLAAYFNSSGYREIRDRAERENRYRLDLDKYERRKQKRERENKAPGAAAVSGAGPEPERS